MTEDVNPNSRAAFVERDGRLSKYGMDIIRNLYRAIGLVGNTSSLDDLNRSASAFIFGHDSVFDISVSSDHITSGNEFIECTDELIVTLNDSPTDGESVTVWHNAGNGNPISVTDGTGVDVFYLDQSVISYTYSGDRGEWVRGA